MSRNHQKNQSNDYQPDSLERQASLARALASPSLGNWEMKQVSVLTEWEMRTVPEKKELKERGKINGISRLQNG